jgi:ERF superfamily
MRRSSETVAALASALAKAQAELINPEKSLTATIRTGRPGEGERSFRYAPLSSGLDIVRKTLGQHEIATLQATAIDQAAGMVHLTTMLAHASGEWVASDWPVCPIVETANPQRMGAALTYARRYALFTLVGIAGEDDIDAPDLCAGPNTPSSTALRSLQPGDGNPPGQSRETDNAPRVRGSTKSETRVILDPVQSVQLRDKLLIEVKNIASADLAAIWASEALALKNSLTPADAQLVDNAFEGRLSELPSSDLAAPSNDEASAPQIAGPQEIGASESTDQAQPKRIDKSILAVAAPRRYRSREHLRYVMQQPCLVCGRRPSDPHHLRYMQPRALGRKASDEFAVPLCRVHHRAVHRANDERAWWKATGIDPIKIARRLWKETRVNEGRVPPEASTHTPQSALSLNSQRIGGADPDIG